jgi:hypothetical protein
MAQAANTEGHEAALLMRTSNTEREQARQRGFLDIVNGFFSEVIAVSGRSSEKNPLTKVESTDYSWVAMWGDRCGFRSEPDAKRCGRQVNAAVFVDGSDAPYLTGCKDHMMVQRQAIQGKYENVVVKVDSYL